MRTFRRKVATVLAAAAMTGGLLAVAAPAHAAGATDSALALAGNASAISAVAETVPAEGTSAALGSNLVKVYRGSYRTFVPCDLYGRGWVNSGAAVAYNCVIDNRFPELPWSLYTFH